MKLQLSPSLIMIFLMPWFNGLMEARYFYGFYAFFCISNIFRMAKNNEPINLFSFLSPNASISFLFILFLSINSIIFGLNKNESIFSFYKNFFYIILFCYSLILFHKKKYYKQILKGLFINGAIISGINILASFFEEFEHGINLIVDYPNTLALLLLISLFCGIFILKLLFKQYLIKQKGVMPFKQKLYLFLYIIGILICFYGLYLTKSRAVLSLASISIPFIIFKLFFNFKYSIKSPALYTLIFCIPIIVGFTMLKIDIIKNFILNTPELLERFAYYKDALNIISVFWLKGIGPGAWPSIQFSYQTALYSATRWVHSSVIQYTLDYGISGLLTFLFLVFAFYRRVLLSMKNKSMSNQVFMACSINTVILIHSLIDFDLEFPFIFSIFVLNFSFISSFAPNFKYTCFKNPIKKNSKFIISLIFTFTILLSIPFALSDTFQAWGLSAYSKGYLFDSSKYFEWSYKLNPLNNKSYFLYGEVCNNMFIKTGDMHYFNMSISYYTKASDADIYNPVYQERIGRLYQTIGDFEKSKIEYKKLIQLQPLVIEYYQLLAESTYEAAKIHKKNGKKEIAAKYFNEIIQIEDDIIIGSKKLASYHKRLKHQTNMTITPILRFYINAAKYELSSIHRKNP